MRPINLGSSVSLSGNLLVVGAYDDDHAGGIDAGSAYLFQLEPNGSVTELGKVMASDAYANDEFGRSVSLFGDTFAVGAEMHDPNGLNSAGAAYLFRLEQNGSISFLDKVKDGPAGAKLGFPFLWMKIFLPSGPIKKRTEAKRTQVPSTSTGSSRMDPPPCLTGSLPKMPTHRTNSGPRYLCRAESLQLELPVPTTGAIRMPARSSSMTPGLSPTGLRSISVPIPFLVSARKRRIDP